MDQILKIKLGREVKDYLSITFGLICYALGWAAFLLPYQIRSEEHTSELQSLV